MRANKVVLGCKRSAVADNGANKVSLVVGSRERAKEERAAQRAEFGSIPRCSAYTKDTDNGMAIARKKAHFAAQNRANKPCAIDI